MMQEKGKEISAKDGQKLQPKQTSDAEESRTQHRANRHHRLVLSVLIFTIIAWLLGKADVSIIWIFALLAWVFLWWKNTATRVIDLATKQAEIDKRREKALSNAETVEWLNFLINRWFVFSDRSLLSCIKTNLDPMLESQKPSFVGSIEVVDFTLGNRTPYFKYVRAYDNHDDQRKLKASELNFNHPPDDLMTRGKYQAVIHLDAGLTSPEARFIIRIRLGNKGFLGTGTDVAVEDLHIHGKLQLLLSFNQNIPFPHLAAVTLCFTEEPDVSFNIRFLKAVQLMELPLIRQWITQMVNDYLKLALVDPGHITIPLCDDPEVVGRGAEYACGVLTLTINGGLHGKLTDDPYWCSVRIDGQKRYTKEVMEDNPWTDHVSLLVYNLHADKLVIKLKGRRKLGTKYTVTEHVITLSKLCLESNPIQEQVLEKSSFKPATLTVQMEFTPLPVIDVCHTITHEEFNRNYTSRLRNLHPNEVSGVLLVCAHSGQSLVPMDKHGLSDPYCVIYENSKQAKRGEAVKGTLSPVWDTMVEILVADFTQTTLSFVVLDKDTNAIKMIKDERGDFMGSCNLSLTEVSPVLFKKNLDLLYKVKGSGMMKAGKLYVSAIFRPVPSVAKSEVKESCQGFPEGEPPGPKDAKTEIQTLEALLRAERGTVEINIYQGRNLVAKDVNGKSDPFVTVKEGSEGREKFRTRTIINSLDPVWKETAIVAMPDVNGLLLLEVWDKDPLTQERMGQIGFTTEKLKDLGMAPYEKRWYRLRGVKSGDLQLAFKYTPPQVEKVSAQAKGWESPPFSFSTDLTSTPLTKPCYPWLLDLSARKMAKNLCGDCDIGFLPFCQTPAEDDTTNNNKGNNEFQAHREKTLSANGSPPPPVNAHHTSPQNTSEEIPQEKRSIASRARQASATQTARRNKGGHEENDDVFTPNMPSYTFSETETDRAYELKAWPRKSGRLKSVVDTVRSIRSRTVHSAPAAFSGAESGSEESSGQGSQTEGKDKPKNTASKMKAIRKKLSFLKERRQRSVSESHLGVLYSSQDDMDGVASNGSKTRAMKKFMRRSSENLTGSTTVCGPEKSFHSLPNSPITATSNKHRFKPFQVGQQNSRSTASCSSNSPGSSTTQEKCQACDFNVLILSECPDCKASQQESPSSSFQERLIL